MQNITCKLYLLTVSTRKYFFRPIRCKASTMYLLSRHDTTAHGMPAVYTASSHPFNPFTGTLSYTNNIKQNKKADNKIKY
jgi:hypothetical protein